MNFESFKLNADGLLPVVTQDYKTKEVLMVAYMNKEAFDKTLETGKVHYYSRSRQSLWLKGETSGHYQSVKKVSLDCDEDTLLILVEQVGVACHTGQFSCFYKDINLETKEIEEKETGTNNVSSIFEEVYGVILDRKVNPKEGSYTNYLFDKGIDKILKKVGEETSEVIIGAKNEGSNEVVYEISDLLYHLMVLMVEKDVEWKDVCKELEGRK